MGDVLKKVTLVPLAVAYALDPSIKRLNHLQKDMARGNDVIDDILVDGELARMAEQYTGLGDLAAAAAAALIDTQFADGQVNCFGARLDVRQRADGVCDQHDFGALRGLGGPRHETNFIAAG